MGLFENAKAAMRSKRAQNNARIRGALHGVSSRTADLMFDLSQGEKGTKLDNNRRAHVKAIELVSSLLSTFSLPARPRLQYQGMIRNIVDDNGIIEDGVIRVGATLHTLMGHKAHIDIPVIVKNKSLIEPAVFYYDNAPYVMCGPALEDLIRRGSLQKEIQPRTMYAPPDVGAPSRDEIPREPITNLEHMFSPGARNPFNFRRQYAKGNMNDPKFDAWVNIDNKESQVTTELCNSCGKKLQPGESELCTSCKSKSLPTFSKVPRPPATPTLTPPAVMRTAERRGEPRKRTNIDTPTEFPELGQLETKDNVLDPAERCRDELFGVGADVALTKDIQARERGGGYLIVPSGERGKVVKDSCGDGKKLQVHFHEMYITTMVPMNFLRSTSGKKAATVDQVKNEVKAMLREGYDKIDIKDAITRRYPQHAKEALGNLDRSAQAQLMPVAIAVNYPEDMLVEEVANRIKTMVARNGDLLESEVGVVSITSEPAPDQDNSLFATAEIELDVNFVNGMSVGSYMEDDDGQVGFSLEAPKS